MSDPYPVFCVDPAWKINIENMGTKKKFWYLEPSLERKWLFKYPRSGSGEHWAEKIPSEIANRMAIDHARIELAECEGLVGSASKSFSVDQWMLYHGNQLLNSLDDDYDPTRRWNHQMHTVERIFGSLAILSPDPIQEKGLMRLVQYLVLDAVIGNVDRHHENWGILCRKTNDHWSFCLAPTFDHASSLGRELSDNAGRRNRARYLDELGIDHYVNRAKGAVYVDESCPHAPSPLELVRLCLGVPTYRKYFTSAIRRLEGLRPGIIEEVVESVPSDWMTPVARRFAISLMCYAITQLRNMV